MELQYAIAQGYETTEPQRGSEGAAGLDIYMPKLTDQFLTDFMDKNMLDTAPTEIYIRGGGSLIIPTGLRFNIPTNTYLEVANRGSMGSKGLIFGAHIIDSDYVGIVFINLLNVGDRTYYFNPGNKFAQIIHKEYIHSSLRVISEKEIKVTLRGSGALGSTGK